jgi:dipeptidyl aminopeptidase/acylaminoacyl peptidase
MDRRLGGIAWDADGETLTWLEGRSDQGVLVVQPAGADGARDLSGELNVRAEVGYGGGDFTIHAGWAYVVQHKTGRILRLPLHGGVAGPITPSFGQAAAPAVSPDGRWVAYVHHDGDGVDRLAIVDAEGRQWPQILSAGHDFYMQPRWSPDGRWFAWVAWDHPQMPWDGTLLYLARVVESADGRPPVLADAVAVAGGPEVAVFQPEFSPAGGSLVFISDETGWGRLSLLDLESGNRRRLTVAEAEHGQPAWVQGLRTYAITADGRTIYTVRGEQGFRRVYRLDVDTGASTLVPALAEYTDIDDIVAAPIGRRIALVATSAAVPPRIVVYDAAADTTRIVARSSGETVGPADLSSPEPLLWPTAALEVAHGLYYPPASSRFTSDGQPPLIVLVHGGPTSQARARWDPMAQFFATRGCAVLQVNYRGSTGYGRDYMLRLRGSWGVCDVEDAISGARHLIDSGRVDPARTVIMGGSAGGFTVLQAMAEQPDAFTAGICLYGVSNQIHLATQTHKFEERYTDSLIGPLPEAAALYRARSPIFHAERIRRPLAVFQGEVDQVVPRAQSDVIVEALRRSGTPHVYHVYEGEGHGWRKRETIAHFWQAVDDFLREHVIYA